MRPSGVSINPPVSVEWEGKIVQVSDAREAIRRLELAPEKVDAFLTAVYAVMPSLVADVSSIAEITIHFGDIHGYLKALKSRWSDKIPLVEEPVAAARAAICQECPKRVRLKGCYGCSGISKLLLHIPKELSDPLKGCSVCKCYINNKVWMAAEALNQDERNLEYPANCWMNDSSLH